MADGDDFPYDESLSDILLNIVKQAQADGVITAEEGELINTIQVDFRDFEEEVANSVKKGKTSLKEIFMIASEKMLENAKETANSDGIITEDEEAILLKLQRELDNISLE